MLFNAYESRAVIKAVESDIIVLNINSRRNNFFSQH